MLSFEFVRDYPYNFKLLTIEAEGLSILIYFIGSSTIQEHHTLRVSSQQLHSFKQGERPKIQNPFSAADEEDA